jgi:hypothetical protein
MNQLRAKKLSFESVDINEVESIRSMESQKLFTLPINGGDQDVKTIEEDLELASKLLTWLQLNLSTDPEFYLQIVLKLDLAI